MCHRIPLLLALLLAACTPQQPPSPSSPATPLEVAHGFVVDLPTLFADLAKA